MKLGLTLPSFVRDPEIVYAVARAAEDADLDGVFVYDHLFRRNSAGERRPALEGTTLLGAVAAETSRIAVGTFVARATLRPAAQLAVSLETANRVSGGRVIAGIGAGDGQSREEMETFGFAFGSLDDRVRALSDAVDAARGRGFPVWVGGTHPRVREVAARTDGWNRWGSGGDAATFASQAAGIRTRAEGGDVTCTWGGLVLLGSDDAEVDGKVRRLVPPDGTIIGTPAAVASELRAYADAGADWIIAGPIDSSEPGNAALLADVRSRLDGNENAF